MNKEDFFKIGYNKVTSLTYAGTFTQQKTNVFATDQIANRDSASWKKSQVIEITDKLSQDEQNRIIDKWKNLSWFDQQLLLCGDDGDYLLVDGYGEIISNGDEKQILSTLRRIKGEYIYSKKVPETEGIDNESLRKIFRPDYLAALRTKPFLLLAGISGTGKSRIVKEMAYVSCPDEGDLRKDKTSPGNYCLVEVKPNWNDSTELLGYETVLDGGNYHLTKFVKFLIKAMQHENVPFFVCLDEMNLAAVEQYFAEFLSILESRKDVDGTIKSEPLIPAAIFEKYQQKLHEELFPTKNSSNTSTGAGCYTADDGTAVYLHSTYAKLMEEGLRIPRNLIVVGTVNMDDTTYQFSRKVIDRAMTIEMNEVNLDDMFDTEKPDALSYREDVVDKGWFFAPFAQSNNALQQMNDERELLAEKIKATIGQTDADGTTTPDSLEAILGKTPFRIAYRVVNELILHYYALRWENKDAEFEALYSKALDNILMMKVLPRIEGNEDLVKEPLAQLATWTEVAYPKANAKIVEMRERLECAHFTSFWP